MFSAARIAFGIALLVGCGTTSNAPAPDRPPAPLTAQEAEASITARALLFTTCYHQTRLRYGIDGPSSYVLRFRIPPDDLPPVATIQSATRPGQEELEACLVSVLEETQFRARPAELLVLDVPIQAPRR